MRVIDAGHLPAYRSQALWHGVAECWRPGDPPALTLVNPAEPYVCIGLHQDPAQEVDEDYCRSRGIAVIRRRLGGGAVYLDRDQLIFHFILPRGRVPERAAALYPRCIEPVLRAYGDLGIAAVYRPLNDIHVDGRKIGGTAAAVLDRVTVFGGMFLFDFDAATMASCLKVPSEKFRDKLAASLADYVTCMRRLLPVVPTRATVNEYFLRHVADCLGATPVAAELTAAELAAIDAEAAYLADPAWTEAAGRRLVPQGVKLAAGAYLTEAAHKAPGGLLRVRLLERDGAIADLDLTGDFTCLPASGPRDLAERLKGTPLDAIAPAVAAALAALALDLPGVGAADLAAAIAAARHREE